MSYFPALLNLKNKKILILGGGKIAYRKIKYFLDFTKDITIISNEFSQEVHHLIDKYKLSFFQEKIILKKIDKFDVVVATVNNLELQKEIFQYTNEKNILYSCVDFPELCDFIFPSYIKKDDFLLTVSTSSKAPALTKEFKKYLEKFIPDSITNLIDKMYQIRKKEPKGKERMEKLKKMAREYIKGIE